MMNNKIADSINTLIVFIWLIGAGISFGYTMVVYNVESIQGFLLAVSLSVGVWPIILGVEIGVFIKNLS